MGNMGKCQTGQPTLTTDWAQVGFSPVKPEVDKGALIDDHWTPYQCMETPRLRQDLEWGVEGDGRVHSVVSMVQSGQDGSGDRTLGCGEDRVGTNRVT